MQDQTWTIRMISDEYGEEDFHYGTLQEAMSAWESLRTEIHRLRDGITRRLILISDEEEITSGEEEDQ